MKSQGIMCSSPAKQVGQHAFLFSLRSLREKTGRKLDVVLDFKPENKQACWGPGGEKAAGPSVFDPSNLLPCFSKGSQAKFKAFVSASELQSFEQRNKAVVSGAELQNSAYLRNDQIMEARPRSEYCQICKETFSDYLKHLNHPSHIRKFEAQCKNTIVDDLVKTLNSSDLSAARARRFLADEEDMDFCRPSCKIRVIQMQNTRTPIRVPTSNTRSPLKASLPLFN